MKHRRIIDLHCDTLTAGDRKGGVSLVDNEMHISVDRLPEGLCWCQCMAVFVLDHLRGEAAEQYFERICDIYDRETALHRQRIAKVTDVSAIGQALEQAPFASILTVEGGSALNGKLENVENMYNRGVRMMTLTWNSTNEIAGGVGDGGGFSSFGKQVVAEMERLGMAVDISHLSDQAFWELCEFAEKPFAASHSNSRAICGHRRNLTDDMFREIVRRGGVVGINYADAFIVDDGDTKSIDDLLRHIHHFLDLGGEDTVALGSDFDGCTVPPYLDSISKIGNLIEALEKSGLSSRIIDKILFENANRYLSGLVIRK